MEERQNPNSRKRLRREDTSNSWSELPRDLLISVFERLSCASFQRVKSVCRFWQSASRQCVPKGQIPWMIPFPEDRENKNNKSCCVLFNPAEKHKLYKTQDLGVDFANSVCWATYRSWLLMRDPLCNLYIFNLFTHERIDLPSMTSQLGRVKFERTIDGEFLISLQCNSHSLKGSGVDLYMITSPVFWIDEKTKAYIVLWGLSDFCVVYAKKGDTSWIQIPLTSDCFRMVYKDHKLYFLSYSDAFKIFDFSGVISQQTLQLGLLLSNRIELDPCRPERNYLPPYVETNIVVTVRGDVLRVDRKEDETSRTFSFHVWKVCSSGLFKKYEQVKSLGDEAMFFDLGFTVPANESDGLERNTIYFNGSRDTNTNGISLFNLETQNSEQLHLF